MARKLKWNRVREISVVDAGANLKGRFPITKRKDMEPKDLKELIEAALETPVDGEQEVQKRAETDEDKANLVTLYRVADALNLTKMFDQPEPCACADADDSDAEGDDDMTDELEKVSVNLQKRFDDLQKQLDTERADKEALKVEIQKAKDEAALKGWEQKVEKNLKYVPGDLKEVAKSLFETAKINAELADAHYDRLQKASELLSKSEAFKVVGTSGGTEVASSEWIAKRADELKKSGLSDMDAFAKAAIENEKKQR